MDELQIYETEHTLVSQAYGFRVPGYVIVQPKAECTSLAQLDAAQAQDLIECLASAEALVRALIEPERVYVLKFGEENPQVHFHIVPRTQVIEAAYLAQVPDGKPYSGARIVDWIWLHHDTLGFSQAQLHEFVRRARQRVSRV